MLLASLSSVKQPGTTRIAAVIKAGLSELIDASTESEKLSFFVVNPSNPINRLKTTPNRVQTRPINAKPKNKLKNEITT